MRLSDIEHETNDCLATGLLPWVRKYKLSDRLRSLHQKLLHHQIRNRADLVDREMWLRAILPEELRGARIVFVTNEGAEIVCSEPRRWVVQTEELFGAEMRRDSEEGCKAFAENLREFMEKGEERTRRRKEKLARKRAEAGRVEASVPFRKQSLFQQADYFGHEAEDERAALREEKRERLKRREAHANKSFELELENVRVPVEDELSNPAHVDQDGALEILESYKDVQSDELKTLRDTLLKYINTDDFGIPDEDSTLETEAKLRNVNGSFGMPDPSSASASEDDRLEDRGRKYPFMDRGQSSDRLHSFDVAAEDTSNYSPTSSDPDAASIDSLDVNAGDD